MVTRISTRPPTTMEDGTHTGTTRATMITIPRNFADMEIISTISRDITTFIRQATSIVVIAIDRNLSVLRKWSQRQEQVGTPDLLLSAFDSNRFILKYRPTTHQSVSATDLPARETRQSGFFSRKDLEPDHTTLPSHLRVGDRE